MDIVDILWNFRQEQSIDAARNAAAEAGMKAQQAVETTYYPYVKQLERLGLVCQAMWSLVQEKTGLTDEDLLRRMTELDLKDGVRDGKYLKPPIDCPKCGSKMSRKFNRCLFCNEPVPEGSAFDIV